MIYRGPGFLAVAWFDSSPTLSTPFASVSSTGDTQEDWEREATFWRKRGEWGGFGAELHDRKKSWSSINHSILSELEDNLISSCIYCQAVLLSEQEFDYLTG